MLSAKEILEAARDLIADPKRWTKWQFARGKDGHVVASCSEKAMCWCMNGALIKVSDGIGTIEARHVLSTVTGLNIASFNDNSPHEDVIAAFDIAICLVS